MGVGNKLSFPGTCVRVSIRPDIPSAAAPKLLTPTPPHFPRFPLFSPNWNSITVGMRIASLQTWEEASRGNGNFNIHLFSRVARSLELAPGWPLCSDFLGG